MHRGSAFLLPLSSLLGDSVKLTPATSVTKQSKHAFCNLAGRGSGGWLGGAVKWVHGWPSFPSGKLSRSVPTKAQPHPLGIFRLPSQEHPEGALSSPVALVAGKVRHF